MEMLARCERILWLCTLLCVPVSATPLLPFGSGTLARPLAILPAGLILLLAAFRILVLGQRPRLSAAGFAPLGLFTLYMLVSGLVLASTQPEQVFKGQTPLEAFLRALLTWAVGLAFYLVARLQLRTPADVKTAIRFLFLGMSVSIAFAGLQLVAIAQRGEMLRIVQALTDLLAVHYDGLVGRAQGMTFEPSWLATQIIVLMMPALIARAISRQPFMAEPARPGFALRLAGGFAVAIGGLLFSGSRFGLAAIIGMLLISAFAAAVRGRLAAALVLVAVLLGGGGGLAVMNGLGAGAGATYVTGPVAYLAGWADLSANNADAATEVTDALALAGRFAAAEAAGRTWLDHPLLGVSLGNDYRYFADYAPDWAFTTQLFTQGAREGVGWLDPNSPEKGNAKNMILRLLAETGVIGFALFAIFFLRQLFRGPARDGFHLYFRLASALGLGFAFLNQDSFVDAGLWIPLAMGFALTQGNREAAPTV